MNLRRGGAVLAATLVLNVCMPLASHADGSNSGKSGSGSGSSGSNSSSSGSGSSGSSGSGSSASGSGSSGSGSPGSGSSGSGSGSSGSGSGSDDVTTSRIPSTLAPASTPPSVPPASVSIPTVTPAADEPVVSSTAPPPGSPATGDRDRRYERATSCGGLTLRLEIRSDGTTVRVRGSVEGTRGDWSAVVIHDRRVVWRGTAKRGRVDRRLAELAGPETVAVRFTNGAGSVCAAEVRLTS